MCFKYYNPQQVSSAGCYMCKGKVQNASFYTYYSSSDRGQYKLYFVVFIKTTAESEWLMQASIARLPSLQHVV